MTNKLFNTTLLLLSLIHISLDAEFRDANWAVQHNVYNKIFSTISEMDEEIEKFLNRLSTKNHKVLAKIKELSWEGTEHFGEILPEKINISANLVLEDSAKENIQKIKEGLKDK